MRQRNARTDPKGPRAVRDRVAPIHGGQSFALDCPSFFHKREDWGIQMTNLSNMLCRELGEAHYKLKEYKAYMKQQCEELNRVHQKNRTLQRKLDEATTLPMTIYYDHVNQFPKPHSCKKRG